MVATSLEAQVSEVSFFFFAFSFVCSFFLSWKSQRQEKKKGKREFAPYLGKSQHKKEMERVPMSSEMTLESLISLCSPETLQWCSSRPDAMATVSPVLPLTSSLCTSIDCLMADTKGALSVELR